MIPYIAGLYPGFHPLVGLQYYTCGKLEWLVYLHTKNFLLNFVCYIYFFLNALAIEKKKKSFMKITFSI